MERNWRSFLAGMNGKIFLAPSANVEVVVRNAEVSGNGFNWRAKNPLRWYQSRHSGDGQAGFELLSTGHRPVAITGVLTERTQAGGSANAAMALSRLGVAPDEIRLVLPQADDADGREISSVFRERGFVVLPIPASKTGFALNVRTAADGEWVIFGRRPSYALSPEFLRALSNCAPRLAILSSLRPVDLPLAEAVFRGPAERKVVVPHRELLARSDLRDRLIDLMARSDLVQMNRGEAAQFLGFDSPAEFRPEMIAEIASYGARYTVITLDSEGAIMIGPRGQIMRQPAFPVPNVDPVGAGDVHLAVLSFFLWIYAGGIEPQEALRRAAKGAAHSVTREGPWAGAPTLAECE